MIVRNERFSRSCAWLMVALAIVAAPACRKGVVQGVSGDASTSTSIVVKNDSSGLLFTYLDEKGDFHVVERVNDVPDAARDLVRVMDPTKDDPNPDSVMISDLRHPREDGTFGVTAMSRSEFDKVALERRKKNGPTLATAPSAVPSGSASGAGSTHAVAGPIIIYGASWCGACHEAAAYLKSRNIPFVEKDIEADSSAQREMNAKIARAGVRGGSIPIIDVRGKILQGFSAQAIEQALRGG